MTVLRLIADDLTGALDAAAPFATPDAPVHLVLDLAAVPLQASLTHSTESRDLPKAAAEQHVRAAHAALGAGLAGAGLWGAGLWFKKIDSVLRGHPFAETLALAQAGGFRRCVFTPAFPDMGRILRDGHALMRGANGAWQAAWPGPVRDGFGDALGLDVVVFDAETPDDLREGVRPYLGDPNTLWAGSGGLARALAPPVTPLPAPPVGLFILGTSHPATRAQAFALAALTQPAPSNGTIHPQGHAPLLLDPVPASPDAQNTRAALRASLSRLMPPQDGSALLITGGDCLALLLRVTAATGLVCLGEVAPGLPLSRIIGGRLDGARIISKSGGFGPPEALCRFIRG
ncbi:MAG: hypothetical protein CFE34_05745 [Rhodobacteraceae bacterium PARR1]|nr:MAG: hypothetical protein CFE34_05745 [Rhodobacteraceae bacterium PARR1]